MPRAVKPGQWNVSPFRVDPRWRWAWRGLVFAVLPGGGWQQDLISDKAGTLLASGVWNGQSLHGWALRSTSTSTGGASWPYFPLLDTLTTSYTPIVWADPASGGLTAYSKFLSIPYAGPTWNNPYGAISFGRNNAGSDASLDVGNASALESVTSNTAFMQDTDGMTMYAAVRSGNAVTFFRNSLAWGGGSYASNPVVSFVNKQNITVFNHSSTDPGEGIIGMMPLLLLYNRALTAKEIRLLYDDPYAMFRRYRRVVVKAPSGTLFTQSVSGALTPAGAIAKQPGKVLTGALTPAGVLSKQPQIVKAGSLTPSATIIKLTGRALTGGLTPAGTVLKRTSKSFAGGLTPSGVLALVKAAVLSVGGSLTPSGTLTKRVGKLFTGGLTPAGALVSIKTVLLSLVGSVTPTGALTRRTQKLFSGGLTPTGVLTKLTSKSFAGGLTPSGVLTAIKTVLLSIGGSITPTGALSKQVGIVRAGIVAPIGTLTKRINKFLSGVLAAVGAFVGVGSGAPVPTGPAILQTPRVDTLLVVARDGVVTIEARHSALVEPRLGSALTRARNDTITIIPRQGR